MPAMVWLRHATIAAAKPIVTTAMVATNSISPAVKKLHVKKPSAAKAADPQNAHPSSEV
jgi:hypothetical protein